MKIGKLNPKAPSSPSSTSLVGKLNFPGFQEVLDFTSAGSESSVSVAVDGDTDKEYKIVCRNLGSQSFFLRLNNDSTAGKYGYQAIVNNSGSINGSRDVASSMNACNANTKITSTLLTPTGLIKTLFRDDSRYTSGTTMGIFLLIGEVFNSTSNVTSLDFISSSGNFTAGTRITVFVRRSQS